jgi:hypothetical protein
MSTALTPRDPNARQRAAFKLADRLAASCVQEVLAEAAAKRLVLKPGEALSTGAAAPEALAPRREEAEGGAA